MFERLKKWWAELLEPRSSFVFSTCKTTTNDGKSTVTRTYTVNGVEVTREEYERVAGPIIKNLDEAMARMESTFLEAEEIWSRAKKMMDDADLDDEN